MKTTEIVTADIGGTHARFALAEVLPGPVVSLGSPLILKTSNYAGLIEAWRAFGAYLGRPLPRAAAFAVAYPVQNGLPELTNMPWRIEPHKLSAQLQLDQHLFVNDFYAVGNAAAHLSAENMQHICGPDVPLPDQGVISVIGPGTGLGVGMVVRAASNSVVIATEGGNIDFSTHDDVDDRLLTDLRQLYGHVSAERLVSGPALADIYTILSAMAGEAAVRIEDFQLWQAALDGSDSRASAALERFCMGLGTVAGNIALAQGASAIVLAGTLALRLRDHLASSGFAERLVAKGEYRALMAQLPVKLITHPDPGLFGAAAAFATQMEGAH